MDQQILKKINNDLILAIKNHDEERTSTVRMLLSSIHNKSIEKRGKGQTEELSDDETLEVIRKEVKKRNESVKLFLDGGREDLAKKEQLEANILKIYLPPELNETEIEKIINESIAKINPNGIKDFGKVMGEVVRQTKGNADTSLISEMLKKKLSA